MSLQALRLYDCRLCPPFYKWFFTIYFGQMHVS